VLKRLLLCLGRNPSLYSKPGQDRLYVSLAEFSRVGHVVEPNEIPDPVPVGLLGSRAVAPRAYDIPDGIPQSTRALRRVHWLGGLHAHWLCVQYDYGTKTRRQVIGGLVWSARGNLPQEHAKAARPGPETVDMPSSQ